MNYKQKYLKYKDKYLNLKYGGTNENIKKCNSEDQILPVDTPIILIYGREDTKTGVHEINTDCDLLILKTVQNIIKNFVTDHEKNGNKLYEYYKYIHEPVTVYDDINKTMRTEIIETKIDSNIYQSLLVEKILYIIQCLKGVKLQEKPKITIIEKSFETKEEPAKPKEEPAKPKEELAEPRKETFITTDSMFYDNNAGISDIWSLGECSDLEKLGSGYLWVTVDKYCLQILFFTTTGFTNFIIYPDPKKINYNIREKEFIQHERYQRTDMKLPLAVEVPSTADILFKYSVLNFTDELYTEDFNKLINSEIYKNSEQINKLISYMYSYYKIKQTHFIAILGKVRFYAVGKNAYQHAERDIIKKDEKGNQTVIREIRLNTEANAAIESYDRTNEIFSNILFKNCNLGFITGGYAGRFDNIHGVTRTGYELAKKYEKPIISIMCNAGRFDKNKFTDVDVFFGMHWGDDTKALSSFSDAAVMIAPFGAWSNIELFYLSYKKKPTVIYLSKSYVEKLVELINIDIYKKEILTNKKTLYELFMGYKEFSDQFIKDLNLKGSDKFGISTLLKNITIISTEEKLNLVDILAKDFSEKNNIKDLFTLWFPHYITDKNIKNSIPVFIDYNSLSNYITNSLTTEQITNKIQKLEQYMINVPELKEFISETQLELSLNRDLENPFNKLTGTYSPNTIKKEPIKYTFTNQPTLVPTNKNYEPKFDPFSYFSFL